MPLSKPEKKIIIKDENDNCAEDDQEQQEKMHSVISSHLYIKPSHSKQTLDKEVILRRIRHRKRMNNVRSVLQSFIGSSSSSPAKTNNNEASGHELKWVDDAFASL